MQQSSPNCVLECAWPTTHTVVSNLQEKRAFLQQLACSTRLDESESELASLRQSRYSRLTPLRFHRQCSQAYSRLYSTPKKKHKTKKQDKAQAHFRLCWSCICTLLLLLLLLPA